MKVFLDCQWQMIQMNGFNLKNAFVWMPSSKLFSQRELIANEAF